MNYSHIVFFLLFSLAFAACGEDTPEQQTAETPKESPAATAPAPGPQSPHAAATDSIHSAYQIGKSPEYPGGLPALAAYMKENGFVLQTGMIRPQEVDMLVQLTIEADGSVTDISVKKGKDNPLSAKAIEVLKKSPKWNPGIREGQKVRTTLALPISAQ